MRILCLIIFMLLQMALFAQQKYFLYIQGENQQPFYIKIDGVIYSSSASGYLILPRLESGSIDMVIGFPKAQWPEQSFSVELKFADRGFILKNQESKGWALFDLQTQQFFEGKLLISKAKVGESERKKTDDPFASSLAAAVNDPDLRDVDLIASKEVPPKKNLPVSSNQQTPIPVNEAVPLKATETNVSVSMPKPEEKKNLPQTKEKPFINLVQKLKESRTNEYIGLVYEDKNGDQTDTIEIRIDGLILEEASVEVVASVKKDTIALVKIITPELVVPTKSETAIPVAETMPITIVKDSPAALKDEKTAAIALPARKDCKQIASEKDMIAARKKAYTLGSDSDIIVHYTKEVKNKCYTVGLLQALSFAFVNDASRYQFFQDAYPWVMDPANYSELERLFVSKEYIQKFKQLINAE